MGLSMMGRGIASASYGLGLLLYHAEHAEPPASLLSRLAAATAKLVDRGLHPHSRSHKFPHVRRELLSGNPRHGGFGCLPLELHLKARWASWALRLACGSGEAPWEAVAAALLRYAHPHLTPFSLLLWHPSPVQQAALPPPLRRLLQGLRSLPRISLVGEAPLQPGPWCAALPLWGNPLLPGPSGQGLQLEFADVAASPITTIPALLAAQRSVQASHSQYVATRLQLFGGMAPAFIDQQRTQQQLAALVDQIPPAWRAAAERHVTHPPSPAAAASAVLPHLGWSSEPAGALSLPSYSVREGTRLLMAEAGLPQQRAALFVAFCRPCRCPPSHHPGQHLAPALGQPPQGSALPAGP